MGTEGQRSDEGPPPRGQGEQAQISLIHEEERLPMTLEFSREEFDYYAVTVQLKDEWYSYYFELCQDGKIYFYDRVGMTTQMRQEYAFLWYRDFPRPTGQRERSCTRFWWTGSAMATARTTWKIGNTAIFKP